MLILTVYFMISAEIPLQFFFEKRLLITQYVAARHKSGQFCIMFSRPSEPKALAAQEMLATGIKYVYTPLVYFLQEKVRNLLLARCN